MKQCSVCGEIKDESEFHVRHRNKDGSINLRSECKSCHSIGEMERYYQKQAFVDGKKKPCAKCRVQNVERTELDVYLFIIRIQMKKNLLLVSF